MNPDLCPRTAVGRSTCAEFLLKQFAAIGEEKGYGCEVTVSTAAPLVAGGYQEAGYECPHGVVYYVEPTSDQILRWAREKVE